MRCKGNENRARKDSEKGNEWVVFREALRSGAYVTHLNVREQYEQKSKVVDRNTLHVAGILTNQQTRKGAPVQYLQRLYDEIFNSTVFSIVL